MNDSATAFFPSLVADLDVAQPIAAIDARREDGTTYRRASVLVRLHGHPLGMIDVDVAGSSLEPEALVTAIDSALAAELAAHLTADGMAAAPLTVEGFGAPDELPCWAGAPTSADMPRISVIIATKDRTAELRTCLDTLLQLDYPDFEVVVVDNGPSDSSTSAMMAEHFANDPRVKYVFVEEAGTSNARNQGVAMASGEIVAFTDDDVVIDANWLRAIARRFALQPELACVTGLVLPAAFETQPQAWFEQYGGFNKGYATRTYRRHREPDLGLLYPYTAGTFGSGNNSAFRRSAFLQLGGFDTRLGPGSPTRTGEDLDLFLAVIMAGEPLAYEPAAVIHHFHRADYAGLRRQLRYYGIGLTAIFTKWAMKKPSYALEILGRVPLGAWQILSPTSSKNAKKATDYPGELGREELIGLVQGPLAWFRSRRVPTDNKARTGRRRR